MPDNVDRVEVLCLKSYQNRDEVLNFPQDMRAAKAKTHLIVGRKSLILLWEISSLYPPRYVDIR